VEAINTIRVRLPTVLPFCHQEIPETTADHRFTLVSNKSGRDTLYENGVIESMRLPRAEVLSRLESRIRLTVAEYAVDHVFIHAGVVVVKGKAIMLPGRSYSGKSTLTSELVKLGATYYSDEYAVLTVEGTVIPFLKPLTLRVGLDEREIYPVDLQRLASSAASVPVGRVIFTKFEDGARFAPVELSKANGVLELIKDSISIQRNPAFTFDVLSKMSQDTTFSQGIRGDAKTAAATIFESSLEANVHRAAPRETE
jgi:hypothetical protein